MDVADYPDPSMEDILGSYKGIKPTRACGADFCKKNDVTTLPQEALTQLGTHLGNSIRSLTLPLPMLLNFISLAPKAKGGERPITVTSILYAALIRIFAPDLAHWTEERCGFWDSAVKGSSALTAALARSAEAEIAYHSGKQSAGIFWDSESFFDSICLLKLVDAAIEMDFSPVVLYLGLQCHLCTRHFKIGNWMSGPTSPITSIIAGCHLSDKFT